MRRLPWVTLGIVGVCVAVQLWSAMVEGKLTRRATALQQEMARIETRVVAEELYRGFAKPKNKSQFDLFEGLARRGNSFAQRKALLEQEQRLIQEFRAGTLTAADQPDFLRYQRLQKRLEATKRKIPTFLLSYVPARDGLLRMLTSMFAHSGWLHLVGNMWFLYLVGCNLEDRWGRGGFLAFYLLSGVVATLTFTSLHAESNVGLVGASGAVAGAMGAFGVCFAHTRVRMLYAYVLMIYPRWGTFSMRAFFVVGLWALEQLLMTWFEASGARLQVAYSAHAGGLVYGVAVAVWLRRSGVDARLGALIGETVEQGWEADPRMETALSHVRAERDVEAIAVLVDLARSDPTNEEARLELFALGLKLASNGDTHATPDAPRADGPSTAPLAAWLVALDGSVPWLLEHYHHHGRAHDLLDCYRRLRSEAPSYGLSARELSRVVTASRELNAASSAVLATSELMQFHSNSAVLARAMWTVAELQASAGRADLQRSTFAEILARFPTGAVADRVRRAAKEAPRL